MEQKAYEYKSTVDNNLPHFYTDLTAYIFVVYSLVMKALSVIFTFLFSAFIIL